MPPKPWQRGVPPKWVDDYDVLPEGVQKHVERMLEQEAEVEAGG